MILLILLIAILLGFGGVATPDSEDAETGGAPADQPVDKPAAAVAEMYGTIVFRLRGDAMQVLDNGSCAGDGEFASLREDTVLSVVDRDAPTAVSLFDVELEPGEVTAAGACEWTVELGPMAVVERYYLTDREQLWGPYNSEDFFDPIVIDLGG